MTRSVFLRVLLASTPLLVLSACSEAEAPEPEAPPRPVIYTIVEPSPVAETGFTGTIEPRYSTALAFRVLGRLTSRPVNVGDLVQKGDTVAAIDPSALDLSVQSAKADLASAEAQFASAAASEERQSALLASRSVSQAVYDAARQARDSAAAGLEKARAGLNKAEDQRSYARLRPEFDGVVSEVHAEVGETVAAGQPVLTVARPDIREAVVDVPDRLNGLLSPGTEFEVRLQADPSVTGKGRVREVAPQADPQTRLRRVRIELQDPEPGFRLGATVRVAHRAAETAPVVLPPGALYEKDGATSVWLVDPQSLQVTRRAVAVTQRTQAGFVTDDVPVGSHVVTAGVHELVEGQKVRLAGEGKRN
ncbi:efflux RND transporter periplasmic adaptor subunit [Aquamicrobium lusatiense]|uniref:efflux RND transporter periplasmic adaptor subunit n=1 Tax=Aquamicrobium lusatiense TaxID=89772 RepID=UPI0024547A57|nr:efflux RND transporter periplasmic adaptor subunit [Aquamicrobium lusatiense]MDH4992107.1 efflux RND transporter periplasmic adaptor subunit [Aquamicrobium lusatiense]